MKISTVVYIYIYIRNRVIAKKDSDAYCAATLGGQKPLKMLTVTHFPQGSLCPLTFWKYSHPPSHHISSRLVTDLVQV